jgi:hypothetical protein
MKKKPSFVRDCGLALGIVVRVLKCIYWAIMILSEVTNYRAQPLRTSLYT